MSMREFTLRVVSTTPTRIYPNARGTPTRPNRLAAIHHRLGDYMVWAQMQPIPRPQICR